MLHARSGSIDVPSALILSSFHFFVSAIGIRDYIINIHVTLGEPVDNAHSVPYDDVLYWCRPRTSICSMYYDPFATTNAHLYRAFVLMVRIDVQSVSDSMQRYTTCR